MEAEESVGNLGRVSTAFERGSLQTDRSARLHPMPNTCSFEGCGKGVVAKGLCAGHYRQHRAGEPLRPLKPWHSAKGGCSFPDCGRGRYRGGWCRGHAAQHYGGRPPAPLSVPREGCNFMGCPNPHRANGYCSSHLWQLSEGRDPASLLGRGGKEHEHCTHPECGRKHSAGRCTSPKAADCGTRSSGPGGFSGSTATPSLSSRKARSSPSGWMVDRCGWCRAMGGAYGTNPDVTASECWKLLRRGPVLCSRPPRVAARCSRLRTLGPLHDQCSYPGRR